MNCPILTLGELTRIRTGKLDANAANENGLYPFFTCAVESLSINTAAFDCKAVLVAGNGDLNVKYYEGKFNAYQRTYVIESLDESKLFPKYLYLFLDKHVEKLREQAIGGVIKYIKLGNLTDAKIPLPPLEEQKRIAAILDKASEIKAKREQAITKIEELAQSKFVEMFGDPVANDKGWQQEKLVRLVEGKYGVKAGPFGSALKKEEYVERGYKIYGQEQVIAGSMTIGDYYISHEKYKQLSSCAIEEGDVLVSLVGSFGKVLVVPKNFEAGIINPRLLKISLDKTKLLPDFLSELLKNETVQAKLKSNAHGGTMGILNAGLLKDLVLIVPPIELQDKFITQREKIKNKAIYLHDSLTKCDKLIYSLQHQAFTTGFNA